MKSVKKITAVIIAIFMIIGIVPVGASAQGYGSDSFFIYTVDNGEATITGYNINAEYSGYIFSNVLVIPSYLDSYPVKAIGDGAFSGFPEQYLSVSISDGIRSVGDNAFSQCSLSIVTFPGSLQSLGSYVFSDSSVAGVQILPHAQGNSLTAPYTAFEYSNIGYVLFYGSFGEWSDPSYPGLGVSELYFAYGNINLYNASYIDGMLYKVNSDYSGGYSASVFGINSDVIPESIDGITVTQIGSGADSYGAIYPTFIGSTYSELVIPKSIEKFNCGAFSNNDSYVSDIKDIDYCGSESDWNNITVESDNGYLRLIGIHYNYTSHTHSFTEVIEPGSDCLKNGKTYKHCSVCDGEYAVKRNNVKGDHRYGEWTVTKQPTTQTDGEKTRTCSVCNNTEKTTIPKLNAAELQPTVNENAPLFVDGEKAVIYGFDLTKGIEESVAKCFDLKDGTHLVCDNADKPRTGDKIEIRTDYSYEVIAAYTVVVFGDTNGDGEYDATDATIVDMIINGMMTPSDAVLTAADCNHDGTVDKLDVDMLNRAGVLLSKVDQTKTAEELQTDSVYLEYINFISQDPSKPGGETKPEEDKPDKQDNAFVRFFKMIWSFIKSLFKR